MTIIHNDGNYWQSWRGLGTQVGHDTCKLLMWRLVKCHLSNIICQGSLLVARPTSVQILRLESILIYRLVDLLISKSRRSTNIEIKKSTDIEAMWPIDIDTMRSTYCDYNHTIIGVLYSTSRATYNITSPLFLVVWEYLACGKYITKISLGTLPTKFTIDHLLNLNCLVNLFVEMRKLNDTKTVKKAQDQYLGS